MSRLSMAVLLFALLLARDSAAQFAQCPELPFYVLVPFNYPCPIHPRMCRTDYGYCRIGVGIQPGTPCQCIAANGQWYPGVCSR
jgi:hypothetical protein